ncbi:MAG: glycerol-3-phosphate 1-O-acyltransferase PlsY [Candidatus Gastranaerophilaceae bacterium]
MEYAISAILAYLIGSIPTGYIIVKLFKNIDVRTVGSGSTGATNVKRVMGTPWFFVVLLLDALKGALPVVSAKILAPDAFGITAVIAALFVILGHSRSIFLKFTGGKSVATGVGTILALSLPVGLITAVIWSACTYFSKYVSFGSLVALSWTPFLMLIFKMPPAYVIYALVCAVYVIYLHRENLVRLKNGTENKVRQ